MKILFVDNLLFEGGVARPRFDLQPHLGLMSLVAVLRAQGLDSEIYDPKRDLASGSLQLNGALSAAVAECIAGRDADVIGFTALGCNFPFVVRVAQRLKGLRPGRPVLLGGPHASILHREILDAFDCFDVVLRHEAEHTLPLVLEALHGRQSLLTVPSATFRTARRSVFSTDGNTVVEDLDILPMPAYDAYPIEALGLDEIRVEAGRGCPFSCTFCSTATFFGRQYRLKSPQRLLNEMDSLNARYGFRTFKLNHDLFTVNRKKVEAFCEVVRDRGYQWSCSARMDCVDEALLSTMRAAGCRHIYFGVETGSARMQDLSRKKLDLSLVDSTLDVTERLGIRTVTSFIAGYPQETQADQDATLDSVARLSLRPANLNTGQLHLLTPEPGTALIEEFREQLAFDEHVSEFNFPLFDEADRQLIEQSPQLFPNHHFLPSVVPRARNILVATLWVTLHELGREAMRLLLGLFEHRLSRLAQEALAWAQAQHPVRPAADLGSLLSFVEGRFGRTHPVVSVLRFSACRQQLARLGRPPQRTQSAGHVGEAGLALSPHARVLREIHDVPALLWGPARAQGAAVVTIDNAGPLSDQLLVMTAQGLRHFELDRETAQWLSTLPGESGEIPLDVKGRPTPGPQDIEMLVELGVLILAPAEP